MKRPAYILITLATLSSWLTGCDRADGEGGRFPLSFSTSVAQSRAGGELTAGSMTSMGVFAYQTAGNFTTSATPNYMHNQEVTKSGSAWTYTPQMYWPAYTTNKVSFFAYAPYYSEVAANGDLLNTFSTATEAGYPSMYFINLTGQTDLLIATPLMDKTSAGGEVKFAFRHALTKVVFKVKGGDTFAKEIVKLELIVYARKGKLTYNSNGAVWSDFLNSGKATYTIATNQTIGVTDTNKTLGTRFVNPIGFLDYNIAVYFNLNYNVKAADGTVLMTKSLTNQNLPATPTWEMGREVTYTLDLSEEGVTVTAAGNGMSWEMGSTEDIVLTP